MLDPFSLFVAEVFVLAGFVKGTIGLGLPTIAMGLLVLVMPPAAAASIMIVPALATNLWQMLVGPGLIAVVRRSWMLMTGVVVGTLAGAGWLATHARLGTALLGVTLAIYALVGLRSVRFAIGARADRWLSPIVGVATGLIGAATGVFVIPAVPYLQAIGLEKEEFVQTLGLFFTVSMIALALNLASVSALNLSLAPIVIGALVAAFAGMGLGQVLRRRLHPATFRRAFLLGLLLLGLSLAVKSAV